MTGVISGHHNFECVAWLLVVVTVTYVCNEIEQVEQRTQNVQFKETKNMANVRSQPRLVLKDIRRLAPLRRHMFYFGIKKRVLAGQDPPN